MVVKQISVFLENKSGRLAEVTRILGEQNIDISALSIADTTNFGILRLIVNKPEEAEIALKEQGFTVTGTSVLAIAIDDTPGSLAKALEAITLKGISIDYMYAFIGKTEAKALVILKVDDIDNAIDSLKSKDIRVLNADEVYSL